jgi:putative ABC transport system permease protein
LNGKSFNIAGTVALPHYVYIIKNIYDVLQTGGFGIGLISGIDMEAFSDAPGSAVTVYGARFTDRENINAQNAKLRSLLIEKGYVLSEWLDAKNNKRVSMPWGNINSMRSASLPVSSALFLLSCIIAGVVLRRMVKSDGVIIGALYALGYRRRELTVHYITIPILLSALGGMAGVFFALPLVEPAVDFMTVYYILPKTGTIFSPLNLLIAVLLPVALLGLASYFSIRGILKKTAAELMKGDEQKAWLNCIIRRLNLERFTFNTKFQLREQLRSIPRLLFLTLGTAAASMVMLFGFFFNYAMNVALKKGMIERYVYPIEYNFREIRNLQDGNIPEGADPFYAFRCYVEDRESLEFYLIGMEADSAGIKMNDTRGNALPRDQVNITSPLASRLKLREGDTIHFVNKLDGKPY